MKLTRYEKNVHQLDIGGTEMKLAVMGDLHWDSPHCDREKLKKDLDYCLDNSIPILGIGDWFDIMASKKTSEEQRTQSDQSSKMTDILI